MTRGRTLLIFKVRGQRSRSHLHIVVKPCKHDTDWTIWARTVTLGTHTAYDKRTNPIDFQGQGQRSRSHLHIVVKPCKHDTDWTIWARSVKLGTHTTYDKRTNPIDFQGQGSKFKVTCCTLLLNLVNTIQTAPFKLGPSNLVHIVPMTSGRHIDFQGQGSKVKVPYLTLLLSPVNKVPFILPIMTLFPS